MASEKHPSAPPDVLGPLAGSHGPAAIVREMARDLYRQDRLLPEEAAEVDRASRVHDWPAVRKCVRLALVRGLDTPAPVAVPAVPPAAPDAAAADGAALMAGLLRLVMRFCDSLPRLAGDDLSLVERLQPIRALLSARLTPERLKEADERISALVDQQLERQRSLKDAQSSMKDLLVMLVERLGALGGSTARFQDRLGGYQQELAGTPDLAVLSRVAGSLLSDTRAVAEEIHQSQVALAEARRKVESYELRVRSLEHELAQTSRMVQNDPLTHVLNRRGLEEVFRIEVSRSARYRVPLTIAILDLDDFKLVNDTLGHAAGDRALLHFVTTARACLRSTELIARTGGEEFAVIFPATGLDEAIDAIARLQEELQRNAFQHDGHVRRLSFSGGAACWREGETLEEVMHRADAAMYRAKHGGKRRVLAAP